jgi:hypothetical protein
MSIFNRDLNVKKCRVFTEFLSYKGCPKRTLHSIDCHYGCVHGTPSVNHDMCKQNGRIRTNGNGMTCLVASIPVAESIKTEMPMPAFKCHHITISVHQYHGTLQDLSTTINRKLPGMLMMSVNMLQDNVHPLVAYSVWGTLCSMCWMILDHFMNSLYLLLRISCVQLPQEGAKRS